MPVQTDLRLLEKKAALLRIDSVRATTEAGSGHPTSCASAADIVATLFFGVMRFDPNKPGAWENDVFVLSKGHAAPLLYAAWAEAGGFPKEMLATLRDIDSDLEGHPTPRLPFVDVATGSLGQGAAAACGIAYHYRKLGQGPERVYVLLGDGESAEGSVWEAAQWAALQELDNLCVTIDINRLGQSEPTMWGYDLQAYRRRWQAFGWHAIEVDGHDIAELLAAYEEARATGGRPTVVLARTVKGRGLGQVEGQEHWHGKALDRETAAAVIEELRSKVGDEDIVWQPMRPEAVAREPQPFIDLNASAPPYEKGGRKVAPRKGFGDGLAALAAVDSRVMAIDGDVKNSTYTEELEKADPERFVQAYIAEQAMVGIAMGLASRGHVPFAATFACFLARAYDFIRMTAISELGVKFVGTHAGVSIGEDGPSQMGLEDLAMMCAEPNFTVLYPSDATSTWRATWLLARQPGPGYLRAGRPNCPVIYGPDEEFAAGKCKVLRRSGNDRAMVVAAGVTVFEALAAHEELAREGVAIRVIDLFSVLPIDREELIASARDSGGIVITVEDHYAHGGIGDAVLSALAQEGARVTKLAVREIPRSGNPEELLDRFGISARHIVEAVKSQLK